MIRSAQVTRHTSETQIEITLNLDGQGVVQLDSGVPFLDHMLDQIARHGLMDLTVKSNGDTHIDDHHTVEDVGICLGKAFAEALGDKRGLRRYGHAYVPMDETLARVCLDFSNRPYLHYDVPLKTEKIGNFDGCLAKEFLRAFALNAGCTLHVEVLYGENAHHMVEAVFKALGRACKEAVVILPGLQGPLSSKGSL